MKRYGNLIAIATCTPVLFGLATVTAAMLPSGVAVASPTQKTSMSVATTTTRSATATVPAVTKVLVFIEENHSITQMQAGMPYLFSQATKYGYASHYTAITHPSLPNYLAIAGGSTFGVSDDAGPASHSIPGPSVFGAARAAGRTAKSYQESMGSNCSPTSGNRYAPKHNPWAYVSDERAQCLLYDVPSGTSTSGALHNDIVAGQLPNVGEVTPNLDNDAHDGSLATADDWLKRWFTLVYASPDWMSGHLAVVVTADEDDRQDGNAVLTTVIHPSQRGHVVSQALTHYSLTSLLTQVGDAPCIRNGCAAAGFAAAFGLPMTPVTPVTSGPPDVSSALPFGDMTSTTYSGFTGTVNPNALATTYYFQYGRTAKYGGRSPSPARNIGSATTDVPVASPRITGLKPANLYHYRLVATNASGIVLSDDKTFTTCAVSGCAAPTMAAGAASDVTSSTASLNASVNPNGGSYTTCYFTYTTDPAFSSGLHTTPSVNVGNKNMAVPVVANIAQLSAGTTYYSDGACQNDVDQTPSAVVSFTTADAPAALRR